MTADLEDETIRFAKIKEKMSMTSIYFQDETARLNEIRTSLNDVYEEKKVLTSRVCSLESVHVAESSELKQHLERLREKVDTEKENLERSRRDMIRVNGKTVEMREKIELISSLKQERIEESERSCRELQIEIARLGDEEGRKDAEIAALEMKLSRLAKSCSTYIFSSEEYINHLVLLEYR